MHLLGGNNLKEPQLAKAMTWVKCPSTSESEESERLRTRPYASEAANQLGRWQQSVKRQ